MMMWGSCMWYRRLQVCNSPWANSCAVRCLETFSSMTTGSCSRLGPAQYRAKQISEALQLMKLTRSSSASHLIPVKLRY